jgi:hypothetical protein
MVLGAGCGYADQASSANELVAEALANSRGFATTAIDYRTVLSVQQADSADAELAQTQTHLEECGFRRDGEAWMLEQTFSVSNGPQETVKTVLHKGTSLQLSKREGAVPELTVDAAPENAQWERPFEEVMGLFFPLIVSEKYAGLSPGNPEIRRLGDIEDGSTRLAVISVTHRTTPLITMEVHLDTKRGLLPVYKRYVVEGTNMTLTTIYTVQEAEEVANGIYLPTSITQETTTVEPSGNLKKETLKVKASRFEVNVPIPEECFRIERTEKMLIDDRIMDTQYMHDPSRPAGESLRDAASSLKSVQAEATLNEFIDDASRQRAALQLESGIGTEGNGPKRFAVLGIICCSLLFAAGITAWIWRHHARNKKLG